MLAGLAPNDAGRAAMLICDKEMQAAGFQFSALGAALLVAAPLYSQTAPPRESMGLPPRASATDYQSHTQAGAVTLAAEFDEHFIPLPDGTLTTDDFVVVEVALFGKPGARATLSPGEFSLRINGKKSPIESQPYVLVGDSLKDPNAEPPSSSKSKTSVGGSGGDLNAPPPVVKVPLEVRRKWVERVQKGSLAEGDRPLPQAGLIFFPYHGKSKGIHSVELIYNGASGQGTLQLNP